MAQEQVEKLVPQFAEFELGMATRNLAASLAGVQRLLNDYAERIGKASERVSAAISDNPECLHPVRGSEVATRAINEIENMMRNINFSTIARYTAVLAVAEDNAKGYPIPKK